MKGKDPNTSVTNLLLLMFLSLHYAFFKLERDLSGG